jgi:hypothetical protein
MTSMASLVLGMSLNTDKPDVNRNIPFFGNDFSVPYPKSTWHYTKTMAKTKELSNEGTKVFKALDNAERALLYAEQTTVKKTDLEKTSNEALKVYINAILADKQVKEEVEALKVTSMTSLSAYWNTMQEEKEAWSNVVVANETYKNAINAFLEKKRNFYD